MTLAKPVGPGAAARKYDILSAMMTHALGEGKTVQRRVLRLMSLITARYNWQRDELAVGQREIARMWSVDERTVKREFAALRASGWVVLHRPGARGRVSVYGLDTARILEDTRPAWPKIGEDFVARLDGPPIPPLSPGTNVVPLRPAPAPEDDGSVWPRVLKRLQERDPNLYTNWFAHLAFDRVAQGSAYLLAANRFHARFVSGNYRTILVAAFRAEDPSVSDVKIDPQG